MRVTHLWELSGFPVVQTDGQQFSGWPLNSWQWAGRVGGRGQSDSQKGKCPPKWLGVGGCGGAGAPAAQTVRAQP